MIPLKTGERIDDLQRSALGIIQNPAHFCFEAFGFSLLSMVRLQSK